jgi:hypothetical protein
LSCSIVLSQKIYQKFKNPRRSQNNFDEPKP